MDELEYKIQSGANRLDIRVSNDQAGLMRRYAEELILWNKKINLTTITEPEQIAEKHFVDSIAPVPLISDCRHLVDMGSGGGFPGIAIKIMLPEIEMVLIDSVRKKVNFLNHVIRTLGLRSIKAIHVRAEELHGNPDYLERFDGVISRAFADLDKFVGLAEPLIHGQGRLVAMKGRQGLTEISSEIETGWQVQSHPYTLPFEGALRYVIELRRSVP